MKRSLIVVALLTLFASPLAAQTLCGNPCNMAVGQTYSVQFDTGPSVGATGFRLYQNGVQVGTDIALAAVQSGTVTVTPLVAGARGTYALQVSAFNEDGEGVKSAPLTLTVRKPLPGAPTNLRVILVGVTIVDNKVILKFSVEPASNAAAAGKK